MISLVSTSFMTSASLAQEPTVAPSPAAPPAAAAPAPAAVAPPELSDCAVCHVFDAGATATIGPNLAGVAGRKAASTDFTYSDAMKASGITWTNDMLAAFIANPAKVVPGTQMDYPGASPAVAKSIADYLTSLKN